MNRLLVKILIWSLATIAITAIGFTLVDLVGGPPPSQNRRFQFFIEEGRSIYAQEGSKGLAQYMQRLQKAFGPRAFLLDSAGRDLVSDAPRLELIQKASEAWGSLVRYDSGFFLYSRDSDGYWLFIQPVTNSGAWTQRTWLLAAIIVLCYLLARHLTAPLRDLQHAVEGFGKGDFSARSNSRRQDELGELARTFDQMASHIQILVENQSVLLRDISHELRSPLTRLGLAIELARSSTDKDQALDTIEREADRLNVLVSELLSLARINNQEMVRARLPVRLDELLKAIVTTCSVEALRRGCRLVLAPQGRITIKADGELIRRAVENAIRNAIMYSPQNTDVIVMTEQNPDSLIIRVRDFGPGVPQELLSRIFEPFYRIDSDRSRETGGAGLGLAIAQRAMRVHGGHILARNAHPGLEIEMQLPAASNLHEALPITVFG